MAGRRWDWSWYSQIDGFQLFFEVCQQALLWIGMRFKKLTSWWLGGGLEWRNDQSFIHGTKGVKAILAIPLNKRRVQDKLTWRSRWQVLCIDDFANSSSYVPLSLSISSSFWKKLWKASIPNKAKVHVWRIYADIIPSLSCVASKRLILKPHVRVLCELQHESTIHLF